MARRGGDDPYFQKKSLGQVFLTAEWPLTRMVEKLSAMKVERVLEIGPGGGVLTRALIDAGLRVTAVEKDDRFAARMDEFARSLEGDRAGRLTVVGGDILKFDWEEWLGPNGRRAAVVGNIPYNISSPIVLRGAALIQRMAGMMLMTQLEFAKRVVARHDNKDYGSLSVYTQLRADTTLEFMVPRALFKPVPKVDSAVITLTPRREVLDAKTLQKTETVTRAAFTQRRKKLRNSVRQFLEGDPAKEAGSPIDLERRCDSLSPKEFVTLAEYLLPDA